MSFLGRWRNIYLFRPKNEKELVRGLKIWSPRIGVLFFLRSHYGEEIAAACPAARLFLTRLEQLGELPQRRLPVRHPSV